MSLETANHRSLVTGEVTSGIYGRLMRPLLFRFDSEGVHEHALRLMQLSGVLRLDVPIRKWLEVADTRLAIPLFGRVFPNPLGLAAGFDKNGIALPTLSALGFGHIEVGTVTPKPQPGNSKPRIFRLPKDCALINRLGFPSHGAQAVAEAVQLARARVPQLLVGINIGKNKITPLDRALEDYVAVIELLSPCADYLVVNVSSPNTPELRKLQEKDRLSELLLGVQQANTAKLPLLLKIAPDLSWQEIDEILAVCDERKIQGIIATNTTSSRVGLKERTEETGGLSGYPLFSRAHEIVQYISKRTEKKLPVVAVGGVSSSRQVLQMLAAGASLVQVYTGFIYQGSHFISKVKRDLLSYVEDNGLNSIRDLVASYDTI